MSLPERTQPVKAASLVLALEELDDAQVEREDEELPPKRLIANLVWPCQRDAAQHRGHVVVEQPPAFDPATPERTTRLVNAFPHLEPLIRRMLSLIVRVQ